MKTTLDMVNEALEIAGVQAELVFCSLGGGYHYFTGRDVERALTVSVYVNHTNAHSVAEWVELAQQLKRESNARTTQ